MENNIQHICMKLFDNKLNQPTTTIICIKTSILNLSPSPLTWNTIICGLHLLKIRQRYRMRNIS